MPDVPLLTILLNAVSAIIFVSLVAMGLAIIFGLMRVINMAHGELFMLGGYMLLAAVSAGVHFWISVVLTTLAVAAIGVVMERLAIRPLYARADLSTLLVTWGFSIIFQQLVRLIAGPAPRGVPAPITGSVSFLGTTYPSYYLVAMGIAFAILVLTVLLFLKTNFGLMARATLQNAQVAAGLGINTSRIYTLAFGLGAGLAGVSGALLTPIIGLTPTMGLEFIVRSFFVVIIGGLGTLFGAVGGGVVVGGAESLLGTASNVTIAQLAVLGIAILVMLLRPQGLFGR